MIKRKYAPPIQHTIYSDGWKDAVKDIKKRFDKDPVKDLYNREDIRNILEKSLGK